MDERLRLRGLEAYQELLHALHLGTMFSFHVVLDQPTQVTALCELIGDELSAARGYPMQVDRFRIDSIPLRTGDKEKIDVEILRVLRWLTGAKDLVGPRNVLRVLDVTEVIESEKELLWPVFARMNERRNASSREAQGELVLAVGRGVELYFAMSAPDFWSVRTVVANLAGFLPARAAVAERGPVEIRDPVAKRIKALLDANPTVLTGPVLVKIADEFDDLRGRLLRAMESNLNVASELAEQEIWLCRQLLEHDPTNSDWIRDLSVSFDSVGRIHQSRGDLQLALDMFEEALRLRRALIHRDPAKVDWIRDLSISLNNVGNIRRSRGELELALDAFEESLKLRRSLLERDPSRLEWIRDLSVSLNNVGTIRQSRGELELALVAFEESLKLNKLLLERDPAKVEWIRDLSVSLNNVGKIHQSRGEFQLALGACTESSDLAERVLRSPLPENARKLNYIAATLPLLAVHKQLGKSTPDTLVDKLEPMLVWLSSQPAETDEIRALQADAASLKIP